MADGEDCKIQEHALGLFRNLVHKHPDAIMEVRFLLAHAICNDNEVISAVI